MKTRSGALLLVAICGFSSLDVRADGPALINYQGRVVISNVNFNGTGQFKFALVNSAGTTTYWSNNGTSTNGSEPTAPVSLTVTSGLYSVLLGDTSLGASMTVIPTTVFAQTDLRLRVWFNDGTHGSQLLSPDQRLAPNGYVASTSVTTTDLVDGSVTSAKLASGAVGSTQIASGAVGAAQIASGAVGSTQMAAGSVGATQIANSTITAAKISSGQVVKSVNGLADAVTIAAGSNISITPSGNTLTLAATAGGGSGPWLTNGTTAYYNSGSVGIGINAPLTPFEVRTATGQLGISHSDTNATRRLGTYVGASASGADGGWFGTITNHSLHLFVNNGQPQMTVVNGGVGIGTFTPSGKLHLYDATNSVTETIETGGATNSAAQVAFKTANTTWYMGTARGLGGDQLYFSTLGAPILAQLQLMTNGDAQVSGTLNATAATVTTNHNSYGFKHTDGTTTVGSYIGGGVPGGWYGTLTNSPLYFFVNGGQPSMTIGTDGTTTVKVLTITGGSDLAEPFPMGEGQIEKGSVVVIDPDHPGRLMRSRTAYDRKVAGIVSGANGIRPGIALHQEGALAGGENVALSGRVYVQAESSNGFIEPGDLLTTSDRPGFAMKVTDWDRAHGAVIGKAMSPLHEKQGTVLVLVTLQ